MTWNSRVPNFRDHNVILGGVALLTLLAWLYLITLDGGVGALRWSMAMTMPERHAWTAPDLWLTFLMWAVMMVAMMLPSVTPLLLLFAETNRRRRQEGNRFVPTAVFLSGYLTVWTGFSGLATLAQWGLHNASLLSPMMVSTSPLLGGGLLIFAGIFQWTRLKKACLVRCGNPLNFLLTSWREGHGGAFRMGLTHGIYCLGCCWLLMSLLFVTGVMNLLWVAVIAGFVLIEKVSGPRFRVSRMAGLLLTLTGVWMAFR